MNPLRWYRRRRVLRFVKTLSYKDAAYMMRVLSRSHSARDRRLALALCDRALEIVPDNPPERAVLEKYHNTLSAGRRVHVATFTPILLQEGETADLVLDVESAFQEGDTQ